MLGEGIEEHLRDGIRPGINPELVHFAGHMDLYLHFTAPSRALHFDLLDGIVGDQEVHLVFSQE